MNDCDNKQKYFLWSLSNTLLTVQHHLLMILNEMSSVSEMNQEWLWLHKSLHATDRSVHNNASFFDAQLWDSNKFISFRSIAYS